MTTTSAAAVVPAPRACLREAPDRAAPLFRAAQLLVEHIERGQRIDAAMLRSAMEEACGGSDAGGAWDWKCAYDACEAAAVLASYAPARRAARIDPMDALREE